MKHSSCHHCYVHVNIQADKDKLKPNRVIHNQLLAKKHTQQSEMWTVMHARPTGSTHSKTKDGGVKMG